MDLAAAAVENGKSIRKAAKEFGISPSTLYSHLVLLKRPISANVKEKESLIASAMESIHSKRLTMLGAVKTYGIPYQTLQGRIKNRSSKRDRKTDKEKSL